MYVTNVLMKMRSEEDDGHGLVTRSGN